MGGGMRFVNGARKKKSVLYAGFAAAFLMVCGVYAQTKNVKPTPSVSTFKDSRDGKTYKKVTIGGQTWMAENLDNNVTGSVCYENSADSCSKYGRLYTWEVAKTVCPSGWHLPDTAEWSTLVDYASGTTAGKKLKATSGWYNNGNGTDDYGFSALPGGIGYGDSFGNAGSYGGLWWSSTEGDAYFAGGWGMNYDDEDVNWYYYDKGSQFSVRCVQD
jgi:uncharacterized protein (TIGR02145 family)